jgi:hypothetical protein
MRQAGSRHHERRANLDARGPSKGSRTVVRLLQVLREPLPLLPRREVCVDGPHSRNRVRSARRFGVANVGVHRRRPDVGVAEGFLNDLKIGAVRSEARREAVSEHVRVDVAPHDRLGHRLNYQVQRVRAKRAAPRGRLASTLLAAEVSPRGVALRDLAHEAPSVGFVKMAGIPREHPPRDFLRSETPLTWSDGIASANRSRKLSANHAVELRAHDGGRDQLAKIPLLVHPSSSARWCPGNNSFSSTRIAPTRTSAHPV